MEHDKARLSDVKDAQHFTVWLLGRDEGASFFALRPINQLALTLDVVGGGVDAGSTIALSSASEISMLCCRIFPPKSESATQTSRNRLHEPQIESARAMI